MVVLWFACIIHITNIRRPRHSTSRICYNPLMATQAKSIKKQVKPKKQENQELDGVFLIKLALYVVLGSLWLKINRSGGGLTFPIPVGLLVGILFSTHEL